MHRLFKEISSLYPTNFNQNLTKNRGTLTCRMHREQKVNKIQSYKSSKYSLNEMKRESLCKSWTAKIDVKVPQLPTFSSSNWACRRQQYRVKHTTNNSNTVKSTMLAIFVKLSSVNATNTFLTCYSWISEKNRSDTECTDMCWEAKCEGGSGLQQIFLKQLG